MIPTFGHFPIYGSLLVAFSIVALFCMFLWMITRKNRTRIIYVAVILFFVGFFLYAYGYHATESHIKSNLSIFLLSIISSVELFLSDAHFRDINFDQAEGWFQILFSITYLFTIATSMVAVVDFFFSQWRSRRQLISLSNKAKGKDVSIFWNINDASLQVAKDILSSTDEDKRFVLFVDVPNGQESPNDKGVQDFIQGRNSYALLSGMQSAKYYYCKSRQTFSACKEVDNKDCLHQMGLGRLAQLIEQSKRCVSYFLDEDYAQNEANSFKLAGACCKDSAAAMTIYCLSETTRSSLQSDGRIKYISPSFLAVQEIKKDATLHPVNFAHLAKDERNQNLGYVDRPYHAMVVGFGSTGQEALRFLHEYAAFPGQKQENGIIPRAPFHCVLVDKDMDALKTSFLKGISSSVPQSSFQYVRCDVNDIDFWRICKDSIVEADYVIVALGDDNLNVRMAKALREVRISYMKESLHRELTEADMNFIILANVFHKEQLTETNDVEDIAEIRLFGNDVWRRRVLSDEELDEEARRYHREYVMASGENPLKTPDWETRHQRMTEALNDARLRCTAISYDSQNRPQCKETDSYCENSRKELQDYSNCLHRHTKIILWGDTNCDESLASIAMNIPTFADGSLNHHYVGGNSSIAQKLEYLAVGEHIRWVSMYEMMGFELADKKDSLLRNHPDMCPYENLDFITQHYDWVVVKTSLIMHSNESNC